MTESSTSAGQRFERKLQQLTERLSKLPLPQAPVAWYSKARTAHFRTQNIVLNSLYRIDPQGRELLSHIDDTWSIAATQFRRTRGRTAVFHGQAKRFLDTLPRYYRRNFHWQGNGYLSEWSAELYEHQVEVLFAGTSDAMRRMIIAPLRERFKDNPEGEGLHFLEAAAGTGRTTRFVKLAFPKARITVLDLSQPYLRHARKALGGLWDLDFVQGDAAHLPFSNATFDAVYSVFLFHELPEEVRAEVVCEGKRVLKPGGLYRFVDSIQKGDVAEFDVLLEYFPKLYHEPFYRNYCETPMEQLLEREGLRSVTTEIGFYSKLGWGLL